MVQFKIYLILFLPSNFLFTENNVITNPSKFEMEKPDVSKPPPAIVNTDGGMVQCSKLVPKAEAEVNTIEDESLLKVVSTILDQDELDDESSDEEFNDELQMSSSLHNHSGTIGQPLDSKLVLNKTLSIELSPKKEIIVTKPHLIANKQGMLYNNIIQIHKIIFLFALLQN
jgi:hypothetical protein